MSDWRVGRLQTVDAPRSTPASRRTGNRSRAPGWIVHGRASSWKVAWMDEAGRAGRGLDGDLRGHGPPALGRGLPPRDRRDPLAPLVRAGDDTEANHPPGCSANRFLGDRVSPRFRRPRDRPHRRRHHWCGIWVVGIAVGRAVVACRRRRGASASGERRAS
jgi:hypothetical protein